MSTAKSKKAPIDLKVALKQLKTLHIKTFAKDSYDGRKLNNLTKSQKETIRRTYREYEKVVTAKSEYVTKNISKLSKDEKESLKSRGYKIVDNRLYVDKQGFEKVSLTTKTYKDEKGKTIRAAKITRKKEGEASETEYHMKSSEFSNLQEMLLKQYEMGNFKTGDYMGVKIGEGGLVRREMSLSVASIYKYLVEEFEPKDHGTDKAKLLKHITLVKISAGDRTKIHQRTIQEKRKLGRTRTKNRATPKESNKLVGKVVRSKSKKK